MLQYLIDWASKQCGAEDGNWRYNEFCFVNECGQLLQRFISPNAAYNRSDLPSKFDKLDDYE